MLNRIDGAPRTAAGATLALARFVAETVSLPAAVEHAARRCFLNILANMIAGSSGPEIGRLLKAHEAFAGAPTATVLGVPHKVDPMTAALVNSASGNILDFDDTHPATLIHPTAPVLAAILPIAERGDASMADVLLALALGSEVAIRVGRALGREHYAAGWHITATCGTIGAAAAAAKMLRLDEGGVRDAIGIACSQAAGIAENFGSTTKSIGVGSAARNGLYAALYAEAGIGASPTALEGQKGYLRVTAPNSESARITRRLGDNWESIDTSPKPYPTCVFLHPVIDGIFELRRKLSNDVEIDRIVVTGHPLLLAVTDRALPKDGHEAKLSLHHSVAVAWKRGKVGLPDLTDDAVHDRDLRHLAGRVFAIADEAMSPETARVRVESRDGKSHDVLVEAARGSVQRPLTDDELFKKCADLLEQDGSPIVSAAALVSLCWQGMSHADFQRILDLGAGRAG
ncbi:MmgE/PrpD family protein [Sinorhizobium meliloti]|uniref:MmgE/PrpD family protein n=1 Tax=Rhizobium meliloti TaxID=382 RepID=UPI00398D6596